MTIRVILAWAICFGPLKSAAQMHDAHWQFAYASQFAPRPIAGTHIFFNPEANIFTDSIPVSIRGSNATYSDKNGSFKYFSNGIHIFDADGQILPNGDTINPGTLFEEYKDSGYPVQQTLTFLPGPKDTSRVFLIHAAYDYLQDLGGVGTHLYYSLIRTNNNGVPSVIRKNRVIIADTLGKPYVTATRHGNGEDWWVIMPTMASNDYNICLVNSQKAQVYRQQSIGPEYELRAWSGQSVISPDGSKFVRYDRFNKLNIFDFDRCTGTLSNPVHIAHPFASPDSTVEGGVAISPNSRYLYLTASAWAYQYDLWAQDIASSRVLVGEYDGVQAPLPTAFYQAQLGPDGKIYVNCGPSAQTLHVIHAPDSAGTDCRFENNAHFLDYIIYPGSMPYFPNYRLGAWEKSPCDTIPSTSDAQHIFFDNEGFKVYPNPVSKILSVSFDGLKQDGGDKAYLEIINSIGQVVRKEIIPPYSTVRQIDVSGLEKGLYFVGVRLNRQVLGTRKVVIK